APASPSPYHPPPASAGITSPLPAALLSDYDPDDSDFDGIPKVIFLEEEDFPTWVREPYNHMAAKGYGTNFTRALEWWTVVEGGYKFKTSVSFQTSGLSAEHRPEEVGIWLQILRRNLMKSPAIKNEEKYVQAWWGWWGRLQPEWRQRNEGGRPCPGGEGPWDALKKPGQNGMLMVLLSLVWWKEIATDATASEWLAAVRDVGWVLAKM
ncbi:hypothetical protein LXA43DRAFT_846143, partial [Ganoderma leucocontextum]